MTKTSEQLRTEITLWLDQQVAYYRSKSRIANRKTIIKENAAKAESYEFIASKVREWPILI